MNKRGGVGLVLIVIITLIVSIIVALVFPRIAEAYASGKIALKTAVARDIALTLDAIYAYPYDIEIEYDSDLSDFVIEISKDAGKFNVKVYGASFVTVHGNDITGTDPNAAEYGFVPVNDNPDFVLDIPKKITFRKIGGNMRIDYVK